MDGPILKVLRGWYASNLIIWVLVWLELHPWEWCSPHWVGHATRNHNIYISPLPLTECFSNVSSCASTSTSTSTWSIIMAFHFERDKILREIIPRWLWGADVRWQVSRGERNGRQAGGLHWNSEGLKTPPRKHMQRISARKPNGGDWVRTRHLLQGNKALDGAPGVDSDTD